MHIPDVRETIDNELQRVVIQNHPEFAGWYASMGMHAQQIVDGILDENITPELILLASEAPAADWAHYLFLRVIAGGNPDPNASSTLTNFALRTILSEVQLMGKQKE